MVLFTDAANAARLQLHALAYNLGNFMRLAQDGRTVAVDQPVGEADQDRRQGRQPRPLRHVPGGRGGGFAANVPRHLAPDRPTAGTIGTSKDDPAQRRTGKVHLDDGPTAFAAMDEGEFERINAPTSPQLLLFLADQAGTTHSAAGNLGHSGDVR